MYGHGVNPIAIRLGFAVDRVAVRQVSLRMRRLSPSSIIAPVLHIHTHSFAINAV